MSERSDDPYEAGMRVRREVLGDEHVDRAVAATTDLDADFQRYITTSAWGSLWTRDDRLDRRTRSCITIALLTALRAEHELGMHIRAGLRNGLTAAGDHRGDPPHGRLRRHPRRQHGDGRGQGGARRRPAVTPAIWAGFVSPCVLGGNRVNCWQDPAQIPRGDDTPCS